MQVIMIQPDLLWEDPEGNRGQLGEMVDQIPSGTNLVILPETFSTGFTMRADLFAEEEGGPTLKWMQKIAGEKQVYLSGSIIIREKNRIFNRLYWVSPEGIEGRYDKRHLFRMGREDQHFQPGKSREVFTLGEFRFLPQVCYDLRFPVFARNREDYDVLFYVANWPASRHHVWETLLRARAIENQAYVLGVSRVGTDGEGMDHLGGTCAVDPQGNVVKLLDRQPGILPVTLELNKIREFREKFPVWKDADKFTLL